MTQEYILQEIRERQANEIANTFGGFIEKILEGKSKKRKQNPKMAKKLLAMANSAHTQELKQKYTQKANKYKI